MAQRKPNILVISSDQQRWDALGCVTNFARTPNLDRFAAEGARFTNGYCGSPICVPTRACMATGYNVHRTGCWSSVEPYHGHMQTWHHLLRDHGHHTASIGKLHFRSSEDDNGFVEEIHPAHVLNGVGHPYTALRENAPPLEAAADFVEEVGWGESGYTRYDRRVAETAVNWLSEWSKDIPFGMFVSFAAPHHPLIAPAEYEPLYPADAIPPPDPYVAPPDIHSVAAQHPVCRAIEQAMPYNSMFRDEAHVREIRAYYFGLVSFLDACVGRVLDALDARGLRDDTLVIFLSDHGEMLGDLGLWTKSYMFEGSARVPMLARGPGIAAGVARDTPVSHIDIFASIATAIGDRAAIADRRGAPLQDITVAEQPDRSIISEYHDYGAITGMTMLRWRNWKYVHYVGHPPQLFDLTADPTERTNLAEAPPAAEALAACAERLRAHVDPEAANAQAFADQRNRIEQMGGEAAIRAAAQLHYTPMETD